MTAPLILASGSPRRAQLLSTLGVAFTVEPARVDEEEITLAHGAGAPSSLAMFLARVKAIDVAARHPGARVLGADTLVVLDETLLAKPRNPIEAREMLARLSGRSHEVLTGVALVGPDGRFAAGVESTVVTFDPWPAAAVEAYVASSEPYDKAGGYGIQGPAGAYVSRIDGCFFNVMGLPLARVRGLLAAGPSQAPGVDLASLRHAEG